MYVIQSLVVCSSMLHHFSTFLLQASPSSMLEYLVYLDNQHNMADCPITTAITPPATPVSHRPCPFIPVPSSVIPSTLSSVVHPMVSSPMTDTCTPISSLCCVTASDRDTLRSTSRGPGCSKPDPVSAAAHLHLLGESLSLIGHHLQETNVSVEKNKEQKNRTLVLISNEYWSESLTLLGYRIDNKEAVPSFDLIGYLYF